MSSIFTTMHIDNGLPVFPYSHARRLKIHGNIGINEEEIVQKIMVASRNHWQGALRISIQQGQLIFNHRPYPIYPNTNYKIGTRVLNVVEPDKHRVKSHPHPVKPSIKPKGIDEWVWLNEEYTVLEAEWSNVWLEENEKIYTPGLNQPILQGIMRTALFVMAKQLGVPIYEHDISWEQSKCWALSSSLKYVVFTKKPKSGSRLLEMSNLIYKRRFNVDLDLQICKLLSAKKPC